MRYTIKMKNFSLEEFGDRLVKLLPRMRQEILRYESHYIIRGTVTTSQLFVMEYLSRQERCRMGEVVEVMKISFSAGTAMLDRLVDRKFVKRFRSEHDRRIVFVAITDKGKKIVEEIYDQKRKGLVELFTLLSPEERKAYLEILEKLVQNLSRAQEKVRNL